MAKVKPPFFRRKKTQTPLFGGHPSDNRGMADDQYAPIDSQALDETEGHLVRRAVQTRSQPAEPTRRYIRHPESTTERSLWRAAVFSAMAVGLVSAVRDGDVRNRPLTTALSAAWRIAIYGSGGSFVCWLLPGFFKLIVPAFSAVYLADTAVCAFRKAS